MLRRWVIGAGLALLALAILLWMAGQWASSVIPLLLWGAILAGGVYFERYRYKPELDRPPGAGWEATGECSNDARGVVTVWYNPATGERAYVRQAPPA
jgi:uncharacterized membrane protein